MKKAVFYIVLSISTILCMANCSQEESAQPSLSVSSSQSPFGKWKFVSYADGKKTDSEISLELSTEKNQEGLYTINGKSSVNFYFAYFSFNEKTKGIKISTLGSTKMAGSPLNMQFETSYFEKLSKVNKYEIVNNQLILYFGDEKIIFEAQN